MQSERTLILVKPDAVQRGLMGEIVSRLERRGLHPVAIKLMRVTTDLAERHYDEHRDKPFFGGLVEFITSSPVLAMVWEGPGRGGDGARDDGRHQPGQLSPGHHPR